MAAEGGWVAAAEERSIRHTRSMRSGCTFLPTLLCGPRTMLHKVAVGTVGERATPQVCSLLAGSGLTRGPRRRQSK